MNDKEYTYDIDKYTICASKIEDIEEIKDDKKKEE